MNWIFKHAWWLLAGFVLIVGIIVPSTGKAETAIHAGGYSYHLATGHKHDYNDNHRLAAIEYGSVIAGYFRNSYDRDSFLVGYGWSKQWGDFRGSVYVGAVRGYRSCFGDDGDSAIVCPIVFPSLYYTAYDVQPGLILFGEALAISIRLEL